MKDSTIWDEEDGEVTLNNLNSYCSQAGIYKEQSKSLLEEVGLFANMEYTGVRPNICEVQSNHLLEQLGLFNEESIMIKVKLLKSYFGFEQYCVYEGIIVEGGYLVHNTLLEKFVPFEEGEVVDD